MTGTYLENVSNQNISQLVYILEKNLNAFIC